MRGQGDEIISTLMNGKSYVVINRKGTTLVVWYEKVKQDKYGEKEGIVSQFFVKIPHAPGTVGYHRNLLV